MFTVGEQAYSIAVLFGRAVPNYFTHHSNTVEIPVQSSASLNFPVHASLSTYRTAFTACCYFRPQVINYLLFLSEITLFMEVNLQHPDSRCAHQIYSRFDSVSSQRESIFTSV